MKLKLITLKETHTILQLYADISACHSQKKKKEEISNFIQDMNNTIIQLEPALM